MLIMAVWQLTKQRQDPGELFLKAILWEDRNVDGYTNPVGPILGLSTHSC
jgi:hypothetical protein